MARVLETILGLPARRGRDLLRGVVGALKDPGDLLADALERAPHGSVGRAPSLEIGDQLVRTAHVRIDRHRVVSTARPREVGVLRARQRVARQRRKRGRDLLEDRVFVGGAALIRHDSEVTQQRRRANSSARSGGTFRALLPLFFGDMCSKATATDWGRDRSHRCTSSCIRCATPFRRARRGARGRNRPRPPARPRSSERRRPASSATPRSHAGRRPRSCR